LPANRITFLAGHINIDIPAVYLFCEAWLII